MPAGGLVTALAPVALSAIGGLFSNNSSSSTAPQINPAYGPLQQRVLDMVMARIAGGAPDLSGYEASGVGAINRGYAGAQSNLENSLTARGLSRSPAATPALTRLNIARAGDTATFRNSIPLLRDTLTTQRLAQAGDVLRTGMGTQSQASSGGGMAGAFTNAAGMLGYLQGKGMFKLPGGAPTPTNPNAAIGGIPWTGGY